MPASPDAAKPRYTMLSEAIRAYGWEGGKEAHIAIILDQLLAEPTFPLARLAALVREA